MLSFSSSGSAPLEIRVTLTPPLVYLDHCVISDLATKCRSKGDDFRRVLIQNNGTLYLSWAHIVELFALGEGPTFARISEYLTSFGGRFVIIEANPSVVIAREKRWRPGLQNPAIDEDFMRLLAQYWDGKAGMSVGILLDARLLEDEIFKRIKELHEKMRSTLKGHVDEQRACYRNDPTVRHRLDSANYEYRTSGPWTEKIQHELHREIVNTNDDFRLTDALDFHHAVVSLSYCTHVVLDKKWARRCRKLDLPKGSAAVFAVTQVDELLRSIESFHQASPGETPAGMLR